MRRNVGREVVRQIRLSLKWSGSKASVSLIAMAVVEVDGFESGRLSVKVSLGRGRGAKFSTAESKCATSD